ncbi:hypothetical protein SAMN04490192_2881 [Pseudomonas lundensis]|uniref:DUF2184 domain-containing protein n=1 Tax=Pseudomonas lundensis TaxID=86185 RepID=UPI00088E4018|nr:major capsid family protein [Pseudomonas lundensis]SDQ71955.1 hypothetical protein SAMN04490192_2881 [Pseudomonas lundensis]
MSQIKLLDAQAALGFVASQTTYIERQVNQIVYGDIQYAELIPVDNSAPEWIKSVTYYSGDKFGKADWINGNSDDIPRAGSERSKLETSVFTAGIGYGYGLEEISQAQMLGIQLQADDAAAARRAYEEMVDNVALRGDARKGFQGLISNSAVTAITVPTGNWATATPQQMIADINATLMPSYAGTQYTSIADTLLLPFEKLQQLAQTVMPNTTMTVLQFVMQSNIYTQTTGRPLMIRGIYGLLTAGAAGSARMVGYRRDPSVLKLHIPMPHRFLPVYQAGPLRWEVPGIFRLGGLDIRLPQSVKYGDGI